MGAVTVSVEPTVEPITLAEAKLQLRVDDDITSDDGLISALITAARQKVEIETRRALVTQTQVLKLDQFPSGENPVIELPNPPLQSVSAVQYVDQNGDTQTLAASEYIVDTVSEPARITPAYNTFWPLTRAQINAVTVTFVCGYASGSGSPTDYAANVPQALKAAIKLLVGHWYENREAVAAANLKPLPMAVDSLVWNYRNLQL
jgi:uncharacterized phiE125 gp8 family phage protein